MTEDLGLNVHEWKYRISDPTIGRFWQVDPNASFFPYNGVYNFAENRVVDGNELEGLQWTRFRNPDGSTHYIVHFKVLNSTTDKYKYGDNEGKLTVEQVKEIASGIARQTEASISGKDSNGNNVTVRATFEMVDVVDPNNDFYVELVDQIMADDGTNRTLAEATGLLAEGKNRGTGMSQINRIQVAMAPWTRGTQQRSEVGAHELGHSAGLSHESGGGDPNNLMTSGRFRLFGGTNITPEQRTTIGSTVPIVTPVNNLTPGGVVITPAPLPTFTPIVIPPPPQPIFIPKPPFKN